MEEHNSGIKQISLLTNVVFITGFVLLWIMLSVMSGMVDKKNEQLSQRIVPDEQVVVPVTMTKEASPTVAGTSVQSDVDESLLQMDSAGLDVIENDYE